MSEFTKNAWFKMPSTRWDKQEPSPMCRLLVARRYTGTEAAALIQTFTDNGRLPLSNDKVRAILLEVALDTFEFDIPF